MQRPYIVTIILLVLALIFTFQNTEAVHINFFGWHFDESIALVTILIFFSGLIGGWLLGFSNVWNKNKEIHLLKQQVSDLVKKSSPSSQIN